MFWIDALQSLDQDSLQLVDKHWQQRKDQLSNPSTSMNFAKGLMSALMINLARIGFTIHSAQRWSSFDEFGEMIHSIEPSFGSSSYGICQAIELGVETELCQKIAAHYCGSGALGKPIFDHVRAHIAKLRREGLFREAHSMTRLATAAFWPADRKVKAKLGGGQCTNACPRCGEVDSALHTFWQCEDNDNISGDDIRKSDGWKKLAAQNFDTNEMFWGRGILSRDMLRAPMPPDSTEVFEVGSVDYLPT